MVYTQESNNGNTYITEKVENTQGSYMPLVSNQLSATVTIFDAMESADSAQVGQYEKSPFLLSVNWRRWTVYD